MWCSWAFCTLGSLWSELSEQGHTGEPSLQKAVSCKSQPVPALWSVQDCPRCQHFFLSLMPSLQWPGCMRAIAKHRNPTMSTAQSVLQDARLTLLSQN